MAVTPAVQMQLGNIQQMINAQLAEYEAQRSRTAGEVVADTGLAALQGAVQLGQSGYGLANLATAGLLDRGLGMSENFQETNQILNAGRSAPLQRDRAKASAAFDKGIGQGLAAYLGNPALLGDLAVQSLPSLIPSGAAASKVASIASGVGAPAKAVGAAATRAAIQAGALQTAGSVNVDAINAIATAGGDETTQQLGGVGAGIMAGLTTGAISKLTGAGALEAAIAQRLAGVPAVAAAPGVVRGILSGAAKEGTEETLQSGAETVSQNLVTPNVGAFEGAGESAALGGLLGTLLGGGLGAMQVRQPSKLRAETAAANEQAANAAGVPSGRGTLSGLPVIEAQEIESIDVGATPLPTLSPEEQLYQQMVASAPQEPLPTMGVEEIGPDSAALLPTMGVEELGLPTMGVEETPLSQGRRGNAAYSMRMGQDLLGDPIELAARTAQEQVVEEPGTVSQNQMGFAFDQSPLQQMIDRELGVNRDAGYQPIDYVEGQLLPAVDQRGLPNPNPTQVQGALPAPPRIPNTLFVDPTGTVASARDYFSAGGSDLFGAPYQPREYTEPQEAPAAAPTVAAEQRSLGLGGAPAEAVAATGWKQALAKEFGLKPVQLKGAEWNRFAEAALATGVRPGTPEAEGFLQAMAAELGADENAKALGTALGTRYNVPTAPAVTPASVAPKAVDPAVGPAAAPASAEINKRATQTTESGEPVGTVGGMIDLLAESSTTDQLDESWQAILATPEFAALPEVAQDQLAQYYSEQYDGLENHRYLRVGPTKPAAGKEIDVLVFRDTVNEFNTLRGPKRPVVPHLTVQGFREATGAVAPDDAAGVYMPDGSLHVIRENISNRKELAFTLLHEQGHEGLRGLLGDRLPAVTNRLWANPTLRKRIKARMDLEKLSRAAAAEETLADMLASGEKLAPTIWAKIRSAVRQMAAKLFGVGDLYVSDAQVDELVRASARFMRDGTKNMAGVDLNTDERWKRLDNYVTDPSFVVDMPMYSVAAQGLQDAVLEAEGRTGQTEPLETPYKSVVKTARDAISKTVGHGRGDYNVLLDGMPLNQIVEFYGKDFDVDIGGGKKVNALKNLFASKSAKHARANQILSRERKVAYDGPDGKESFDVSPLQLADKWQKLGEGKDQAKFNALNRMMQYGTYYRVWPDRTWDQQDDIKYDEFGFTEVERATAHENIRRLWNRVGPEGQAIFKQSQALYADMWTSRFNAIKAEFVKTAGANSDVTKELNSSVANALQRMKQGPYSPLNRFGNYFVSMRDPSGKTVHFSAFDTKAEADAARTTLWNGLSDEQRKPGGWSTNVAARDLFVKELDGINHQQITALESAADAVVPPDAAGDEATQAFRNSLRDALVETYLQSLPTHSLMNHANARRGVDGFNLDAFRAFAAYSTKAARNISSIEHDGDIGRHILGLGEAVKVAGGAPYVVSVYDEKGKVTQQKAFRTQETADAAAEALRARLPEEAVAAGAKVDTQIVEAPQNTDTVRLDRIVNAVKAQHGAAVKQEYSAAADALGQAGYLMFMTSPSQMFINATQTVMVAFPRLAGEYGSGSAIKAIKRGLSTYVSSGGDMLGEQSKVDSRTKQVLQALQDRGDLDFTLAHDMAGLAEGDYTTMSSRRRATMKVASWFMHKSEVFNRQVTAHAAVELELQKQGWTGDLTAEQLTHLEDVGSRAISNTQFDYSAYNRPTAMQGPWRKVFFQFQSYRVNMLAMMARDIRDMRFGTPEEKAAARTTFSWMLGTQLAFAGATGTVLSPIAFLIADLFRDDDELLDSRAAFAQAVPEWLAFGVLSGFIDTGRLSAGSLIPILGDLPYAPKDATGAETAQYHLLRNIGPWAGLVTGAVDGIGKFMEGDFKGAAKGLLPKPFADATTSLFYDAQGVKDARGVTYYDANPWDILTGSLGLRSGGRAEAERLRGVSYQATKHVQTTKQNIMGQFVLGYSTGDQSLISEANGRIAEWNTKYPDLAIKGSDRASAIRNRVKTQQQADATGIPTAKPLQPSLLRALNLAE